MISVIVVSHNSGRFLRRTLETVLQQTSPEFELVFVDNASTDDSIASARSFADPRMSIIEAKTNRGFAGANNDAARKASGDIFLILNPDTELPPDFLAQLDRSFADNPKAGILGAKILAPDRKTLLHCGGRIGWNAHCRHFGRGREDCGQYDVPREVEYVTGAALAVRAAVWQQLGGFDETFYPAYYEDTDLCVRCRKAGWKVLYDPRLCLLHHEGVSLEYKSMQFWEMHHRNRLWFTLKNHSFWILLTRALPAEIAWFASKRSKGVRRLVAPMYPRLLARRFLHRA